MGRSAAGPADSVYGASTRRATRERRPSAPTTNRDLKLDPAVVARAEHAADPAGHIAAHGVDAHARHDTGAGPLRFLDEQRVEHVTPGGDQQVDARTVP